MKKFFSGFIIALSLFLFADFASAQSGNVNVGGICLEKNAQGVCIRYGSVSLGTQQMGAPGAPGTTMTPPINGNQPVYTGQSSYQQGQYQRGTQTADLSFIGNLLNQVGGIIRLLPPILMGAAVVAFFWFLIRYFITQAPDEKGTALKRMGYSLAAVFVMVALWGIIAFFGDAIGINPNVQVNAPTLPR